MRVRIMMMRKRIEEDEEKEMTQKRGRESGNRASITWGVPLKAFPPLELAKCESPWRTKGSQSLIR